MPLVLSDAISFSQENKTDAFSLVMHKKKESNPIHLCFDR